MSILVIAAVAAVVYALLGIRIAQEYERGVVFRLGRYHGVRGPGLYWIAPLFERQWSLDLRTRTVAVEQQETITRDSVTIKVNAVLWYSIANPERAIVAVQNYGQAVYQLALTSLRNIIGQHVLDEVLKERDTINDTLRRIVDEATQPWGIHIEMVEMKDVEIPEAMQRAMAREAEAIREKRARMIKAEAESEAGAKLAEAAGLIAAHPAALELRRMQMVAEIGAEHNTTTIVLMPSEMVGMGAALAKLAS
ncbi:MAG TPA: slipin family protein [Rhizomicrobium sp.]|nr:slipin family protein [Rhizomicrobium sp.]